MSAQLEDHTGAGTVTTVTANCDSTALTVRLGQYFYTQNPELSVGRAHTSGTGGQCLGPDWH